MITSHFSLIIKGCFPFSFWSSGFELVHRVFGYAFECQKKKKINVTQMGKDKIRVKLSSKTNFWFQKKIVTIFDCCWYFTMPVYISCFLVLFKFVSFNYWHIALMQKNRQMNSLFWRHVRDDSESWNDRKLKCFGNFGSFCSLWLFIVIHNCKNRNSTENLKWVEVGGGKTLPPLW